MAHTENSDSQQREQEWGRDEITMAQGPVSRGAANQSAPVHSEASSAGQVVGQGAQSDRGSQTDTSLNSTSDTVDHMDVNTDNVDHNRNDVQPAP